MMASYKVLLKLKIEERYFISIIKVETIIINIMAHLVVFLIVTDLSTFLSTLLFTKKIIIENVNSAIISAETNQLALPFSMLVVIFNKLITSVY